MFVLVRALSYATLFVGLVLVFLPAQLLSWSGVTRPQVMGPWQVTGMFVGGLGAVLVVLCVAAFVRVGRGTPAPFDPPRRLVMVGPYRFVRNPMYIGAGLALFGAALFYRSPQLLSYLGVLSVVTHLFVVLYEEPTLKRSFSTEYSNYCHSVGRWWPR